MKVSCFSADQNAGVVRIKVMGSNLSRIFDQTTKFGKYEFCYDSACADYDWLVVYDELPFEDSGTFHDGFEPLACPPENTILCTWEPVSIKSYSRSYTRQFGHLLSNRPPEAEQHPAYCLGRGYFSWFVSKFPYAPGACDEKSKLISAVCSAKQMRHTKHFVRFRLMQELAKGIENFDWFGRGVQPLERKEDALLPYRYHVAVENHIGVHHWTEKFSDAILCECLPFYAGDPALTEAFPAASFISIPIDDPAEAVHIVREAIAADEYAKRREAVLKAKRLILSEYNFWAQVVHVIETCPPAAPVLLHPARIYARKRLRRLSFAAAMEDGFGHLKRIFRSI